jgi:formylmethanofuran dehydrogenase subunit E
VKTLTRVNYDLDYYCKACDEAFPKEDVAYWASGKKVCPLCMKHPARTRPINRKLREHLIERI